MKHLFALLLSVGLATGMLNTAHAAEAWPTKEIRMIVAFSAGGAVDLMARSMQTKLSEKLGVPILVENYPGAKGRICHNKFLQSDKEGYTIFVVSQTNLTMTRASNEKKYSLDDIAFINANWIDPNIIVARKALGWKNIDDMIKAAKASPDKYTLGVPSSATFNCDVFVKKMNLPIKIIPYANGAAARMALMGGHIDMAAGGADGFETVRDISHALCTFWEAPSKTFPEGTPIREIAKKANVELPTGSAIRVFAMHKDVQKNYPERFDRIVKAFKEIINDSEYIEFCKKTNIGHTWYGPEATTKMIKADDDYWLPYVKATLNKQNSK
ncbi:tripartite tricarboxylate transporter substrate binding protein [uncultured Desulfovibrio sp.]|uniref:Bug family tripartite tricarboxylate transporter substrate binding protein n=1 Tax=uncultured Desulfovibrio sp. TaxID=167968 RepID=UPI00265D3132|nr:tripartite tricarboxylate transporter substrate binding protein [uncultured Desulfovibrio sp.]